MRPDFPGWTYHPGFSDKTSYWRRDRDGTIAESVADVARLDGVKLSNPTEVLVEWFADEGLDTGSRTATKAIERGAYDLYLLGRTMAGLIDRRPENVDERTYYLQLGILFYAEGKIARALSALKEGRLPNPDDWHDLSVYGRMAKYVQEHGSWP